MKIKYVNYLVASILILTTLSFTFYINIFFKEYNIVHKLNIDILNLERKIVQYIEIHNKVFTTEIKDLHNENDELLIDIDNILQKSYMYSSKLNTIKKLVIQTHEILHELAYSTKQEYFSEAFIKNQRKKIINNINRINSLIHKISNENTEKLSNITENIKYNLFMLILFFSVLIIALFIFIKMKVLNSIQELEEHINYYNNNKLKEITTLPNNEIGDFIKSFNKLVELRINTEKKFEKVFKHSNIGICTISKDGFILSNNQYIDDIFEKNIFGLNYTDLFISQFEYKIKKMFIKLNKKRINNINFNYYLPISKESKYLKCSLSTLWNNNDIEFYILIIEDISKITVLKQKEQEQEQEQLLLQQSKLAAMGEMLGSISHQWRQPLNSLGLIFQDIFSAYKHNELSIEYFEKQKIDIMNQLKYMSNTIDEFKSFIKPTSSTSLSTININDTLSSIENLFSKQFKQYKISLIINNQTQKFNIIKGSESYLKQILMNLLSNSKDVILSSSDSISKEIIINTYVNEKKVYFEVIDFAGNIKNSILSRIYEPYFTTKEKGTGLGLYMCKMILSKYFNTNLKVENIEEKNIKGKKFYFSIKI